MKTVNNNSILILALLLLGSCKKDDALPGEAILGLGGYDFPINEVDRYIYKEYTRPFNIEVEYRWDPARVNVTKAIVPPRQEMVVPMLNLILQGWIHAYRTTAGNDFLRRYNFSKFYFSGSWEYNNNGSITLGTAEGGARIVILGVNDLVTSNRENIQGYLYTIHHEFAHIIHQTRFFPQEWRTISGNAQWFTATWNNTTTPDAQKQGFVRNYAKSNPNEDFVETIAFLLVRGQEAYDGLVIANPGVAATFRKKEEIVVNYYNEVLGIDFRALQVQVQQALDRVVQQQVDGAADTR